MNAPATVLHVCMGNICRSPMAERLFALRFAQAVESATIPAGSNLAGSVHSRSAGTGNWYVGDDMNPPAAQQLRARSADATGFAVRTLSDEIVEQTALIVTATAAQVHHIREYWPEVTERTFPLKEFARLVPKVDQSTLPDLTEGGTQRLNSLTEEADLLRLSADPSRTPDPVDDVDDPYGRGDAYFSRVADEIDEAVTAIVNALVHVRT